MFNRVKRLYDQGKLDKNGVKNAVLRGWITEDQYKEITGEEHETV